LSGINEDEEQLFSRYRIEDTVDRQVVQQIREILEMERKRAQETDRVPPSLSQVLEMLLRKGVKIWQNEQKSKD